jgi:23S rRNA (guanosine2251-2'-O)-methyltransferase
MVIAILHNIRSLHNVGAIFRTTDGAGIEKMYLCGYTGVPPRKEISKVALGAENAILWEQYAQTWRLIERLRKEGWYIIALEQTSKSVDYRTVKPRKKTAIILGNECDGIPESLLKRADKHAYIPMRGSKESLNVSVAAGIAFYHFVQ